MKQIRWILIASIAAALLLSGCGKEEEEIETTPVATEAVTTEAETTTEEETEPETESEAVLEDGMMYSYLTGLPVSEEIGLRRPVSVMLNNIYDAIPQSSINDADVIYEAPVEGTITRFIAFYEDWDDLEKIGSVRSARLYYTHISQEFKSVYVHYGQSQYTVDALKYVDDLNGVDSSGDYVFYRTSDRKSPHNAYASGSGINEGIERQGYDMSYPEDYTGHYIFNQTGEPLELKNAVAANKVYPGYTYNKPWFEYNEEDGLYYRYQYGIEQIDTESGEQTAVKNVIFQYCGSTYFPDNSSLDITLTGSGEGMFFTDGKGIPVTWQKDTYFGITHYYNEDGEEIVLNPGKTWVCIVQSRYQDSVVIEE